METEVSVHAEVYLYGKGEANIASPEEIVFFMKRMKHDFRFLDVRSLTPEELAEE